MAEAPSCSCGQNEKKRIIVPCSGVANVGQITNLASIQLAEEGYGSPSCVALLATGAESLVAGAKGADEVLILDGCPVVCAKKIADAKGVPVAQHIVVTELGIAKGPSKNYSQDDVEKLVSACWKGVGKTGDSGPGKKNGCGCGGTC
ncbi:MAG: putative zinc-binding protein [Methanoregula sp.]|nr:putative zinc-binding protein [Methanoregula sp.]